MRAKSQHQIHAFSAGTDPTLVHPLTKQVMAEFGIDVQAQQAKGFDLFQNDPFDYLITVCDRARETCPLFPGNPIKVHWSVADPTAVNQFQDDRHQAFRQTAKEISERVDFFLAGVSDS